MNDVAQSEKRSWFRSFIRRNFRPVNFWIDINVWFRIAYWCRKHQKKQLKNKPWLDGLQTFSWTKFCGYEYNHALTMGIIHWKYTKLFKVLNIHQYDF
jgi:hypothetical protein